MAGFWGKYLDVATISEHTSVDIGTDCGAGFNEWAMELQGMDVLPDTSVLQTAANFQCLPALRIVDGSDILVVKRVADSETAKAKQLRNLGAVSRRFWARSIPTAAVWRRPRQINYCHHS